MKKWITAFLAAAVLLTAAGCSGNAGQPLATEPSDAGNETVPVNSAEPSPTPRSSDELPTVAASGQPAESDSGSSAQPTGKPSDTPENTPAASSQPPADRSETAPPPATAPAATPEPKTPRILIAYFTWADNTVVEDPNAVDVDASTSASVLAPGNAAKIAAWIQQEVGGDLHSIVVTDPYSSDYDECLDRAADEKADNARPALATHVSNMEDYDIVFLGFPNWWYTLPMPVLSFVDEYDFSGKTIVPFCTHGTGGLSSTIRDLTAALPDDVTILDAIGVYRPDVDSSRPNVQEWIEGLNLKL